MVCPLTSSIHGGLEESHSESYCEFTQALFRAFLFTRYSLAVTSF